MVLFLPWKSVELVLGAVCLMLFLARVRRPAGLWAGAGAAVAVILTLALVHSVIRNVVPMTAGSLIALVLTSVAVVSGREIPAWAGITWSVLYGILFGLSAYELQFFTMDVPLMMANGLMLAAFSAAGAVGLSRLSHPAAVTALRVVASWITAAGILMLAFFV